MPYGALTYDDIFFEVLAADKAVCEEMLRTILEEPKLVVEDVVVQSSERNLYGRSVRLDALCRLGDGRLANVEVQRSDNDDHLKWARFNSASITVKESTAGDDFSRIPEVIIVYISEFDFLQEGKTTYHVDKVLRETGTVIDDGEHEIFVNTAVNDNTDISDLMSCFTKKRFADPKFPALTSRVNDLKTTEGGTRAVCEVMQHYENIARQEGIAAGLSQGLERGRTEGRMEGRTEGEEKKARETALRLFSKGMLPDVIAEMVDVPCQTITAWLKTAES